MEVFQIEPRPEMSVLVVGRNGDQYDFCSMLAKHGIPFSFTSHMMVAADHFAHQEGFDVFDELGRVDSYGNVTEMRGEDEDVIADLERLYDYSKNWAFHANRVDHALHSNKYNVIVDTCADLEEDRLSGLRALAVNNPDALFLTTLFSCTATEVASMIGQNIAVVGYATVFEGNQPDVIDIAPSLTAPEGTVNKAKSFFALFGISAEVVEDRVGLVQLRTLSMLINEAAFALMEGVASADEIDKAMKLGVNYPKGLLAWGDEIGLDIVLLVLESLNREYSQERYRPCVLLKQYVRAGWTGKRVGRGFYIYE
jgi:3-hydroxybutyryl-CoA dehydrogenase